RDAAARVPGRRVDTSNPEGAERGLLLAPVGVGVPHPALDGLLGRLVQLAPAAAGALGGLHDLLLPGVVGDAALDTRHGALLTPGGGGSRAGNRPSSQDPPS